MSCPNFSSRSPNASSSIPDAYGSNPDTSGSCLDASGSCSDAFGSCPDAFGSCPDAFGSCADDSGSCPDTDKVKTLDKDLIDAWLAMKSSSIPNDKESCELILHPSCLNSRPATKKGGNNLPAGSNRWNMCSQQIGS